MPTTHTRRRHHPARTARTGPPRLMSVALAAAGRGHHVIPLWPRTKVPALHGEHECPHTGPCDTGHRGWEHRATRDPDLIRWWWRDRPFNVGIAAGRSGLHVIDLDVAHGTAPPERWAGARHGRDVLARLAEQHGQPYPGDTFTVRTPTGGRHLYFRTSDPALRNTVGRVGWRIDSRGGGGYIIAAGSVRSSGLYTVERSRPIAELPAWLVPLLTPPPAPEPQPMTGDVRPLADTRKRAYLDAVARTVAAAHTGTRRSTLLSAAVTLGRLVAGGELGDDEVLATLHGAAERLHGFPQREAERTITDGLRYGSRYPRVLPDNR